MYVQGASLKTGAVFRWQASQLPDHQSESCIMPAISSKPGQGGKIDEATVDQLSGAFRALYTREFAWLSRAIRALDKTASFEDVAQDAFVRFSEIADGRQTRHPRALLLRIATNLLRDQWRKTGRRERPDYRASLADHEPASVWGDQFESALLHDLVRSLPPLQREVFVLSRFGGKSTAEISTICGISVKAVETRMTRALALCAERLRD